MCSTRYSLGQVITSPNRSENEPESPRLTVDDFVTVKASGNIKVQLRFNKAPPTLSSSSTCKTLKSRHREKSLRSGSGPGGRRFKSSLPDQFFLVAVRVRGIPGFENRETWGTHRLVWVHAVEGKPGPPAKSQPIIIIARLLSSEPWSLRALPSLLGRLEPTRLSHQVKTNPSE